MDLAPHLRVTIASYVARTRSVTSAYRARSSAPASRPRRSLIPIRRASGNSPGAFSSSSCAGVACKIRIRCSSLRRNAYPSRSVSACPAVRYPAAASASIATDV